MDNTDNACGMDYQRSYRKTGRKDTNRKQQVKNPQHNHNIIKQRNKK